MEIELSNKTKSLKKENETVKKYGYENAKKIMKCLKIIEACNTLQDLLDHTFFRCHLLTGNLAGLYGLVVKEPFRIIIEPSNYPVPLKEDNGIDTSRVTKIIIKDIRNYHG